MSGQRARMARRMGVNGIGDWDFIDTVGEFVCVFLRPGVFAPILVANMRSVPPSPPRSRTACALPWRSVVKLHIFTPRAIRGLRIPQRPNAMSRRALPLQAELRCQSHTTHRYSVARCVSSGTETAKRNVPAGRCRWKFPPFGAGVNQQRIARRYLQYRARNLVNP